MHYLFMAPPFHGDGQSALNPGTTVLYGGSPKSKNTALVTVPGDGLTSGPPGKEVVAEGGGGVE